MNRKGHAKDSKCALCYSVAKAWPFTAWEALVLKKRSDEEFKRQWALAEALKSRKEKEAPFLQCSISSSEVSGYKVTRSMLFLTEAEIEKLTGCQAASLGYPIEKILGETGEVLTGVFLADPSNPFRRVTLENKVSSALQGHVMDHTEHLRDDQAKEVLKWTKADAAQGSTWPKSLVSASKVPSIDDLKARGVETRAGSREASPSLGRWKLGE